MAKTQYVDIVDHINKYPYRVLAPAKYTPIADYDKLFNFDPLYQPTDPDMVCTHALTIVNLIDMHANNIEFRVVKNEDVFDIYHKLYSYMEILHSNRKRNVDQEVFYQKAMTFLQLCAKKCRLAHKRLDLDREVKPGTLSAVLTKINRALQGR